MKKLLGFILLALSLSSPSFAGVSCSLPFNLQNGTTADATQVMANYNALVTCLTNAAAAGVNNDITALTALATPITPAQGGTAIYTGGASTGSANTQAVGVVAPATFALTAGNQVTFVAGFSNSGATTLNVASTGAKSVFRRTQLGVSATVGGEIIAGQTVTVLYDGTQFQIVGQNYLVGEGKEWFTTLAPAGYLLRDGSSYLRTDYPDLFSVIGTTYGSADAAHFNVPDETGRVSIGQDANSRISGICSQSNTLGTVCGVPSGSVTIGQTNLPNVSFTVSGIAATSSNPSIALNTVGVTTGGTSINVPANGGTPVANIVSTPAITITSQGTAASGGSATAMTILNGSLIVNKIIKY